MAKDELPENERRQDENDALVMRARQDSNAFILLYDIYYEKVYRYCFTNLRVKQITEDITSLVFIRAAGEIQQFKAKTRRQYVEWIINIASVEIKKYLKKTNLENCEDQQISIDSKHKERLRTKILDAYQQGQNQASKMVLYLAAGILVVVISFIFFNLISKEPLNVSQEKPKLKKVLEPQKPGKIIQRLEVKKPIPQPEINEPVEPEEEISPAKTEPNKTTKIAESKTEGFKIFGKVVDWQQRPVQATITKGPFPKTDADRTICDANGNFQINFPETGVEVLTAQCEGAAPAVMPIEVKSQTEPITITLSPPSNISGQVIDINGIPIEGVTLNAVIWQGVNSLVYSAKTDADGFFLWDSAPPDEVFFDLQKKNFMSVRNYPMKPGIEYKILMVRPFKIHGTIISAEPSMQIENFIMTVGYYFEKDKITWQDANSVIFTGDKYDFNITEPFEFKLKLQSEGFKMVESPTFNLLQNSFDYDFVMHPEQ